MEQITSKNQIIIWFLGFILYIGNSVMFSLIINNVAKDAIPVPLHSFLTNS